MLKTHAVKSFLNLKTHSDLASLYNEAMEVQVNVAREGGKQIDAGDLKGRAFNAYTDGVTTWKPFRIPAKAKTEPEYTDTPITFSIEKYAEGIGMTGWDWKNRLSRWVAFDFDAILGHSDRHGKKLDDKQLAEIQDIVKGVPFVTLRRSTSGKGLHLYIFLEPVTTANHTEHAALARSILSMLSGLCGYDFTSKVDICGGNMWVWHRKMYMPDGKQNDGLKLLKQGERLKTIPANWRDHLTVTRRQSTRAVPDFLTSTEDDAFADLIGKRNHVSLDSGHRALMEWLANTGAVWWWDQEAHSLVTHTVHLKEAHTALKMCGTFETLATGADRGADHNCFGGDTEVLTQQGPKKIRDLVGRTKLYIKTDKGMEWADVEVKSFGKQKTFLMQFGNNTSCRATWNHSWLTQKGRKLTHELSLGFHELPLAPIVLPVPDDEGYAHGFVYGDGYEVNTRVKAVTVSSIDWLNPIEEEVFCAVVPIYHNFTLANGVITGNCFCFPLRNSGWAVRRYGPGTQEHASWEQDGSNWTRCFLNRNPDFVGLARLNGGVESEKGGYVFRHAEHAATVLLTFGVNLNLPNFATSRKTIVKQGKEGKIIVHIEAEPSDDGSKMAGWLNEKGFWRRVINCKLPHNADAEPQQNYDDVVRHIVSNDTDAGWVLKRDGGWTDEPLPHIRYALNSMGEDSKETGQILGSTVLRAWTLVNKPFQPEYPGNREWNRNAAQLAIAPTLDLDNLSYPHWSLIMNHLGTNLTESVLSNEWCKSVGICTGADFLMLWIASLIRRPDQPTTYLSFVGSQDCGKSIFHEAISEILLTKGVVRADNALQSQGNFNGELENCVLAVVEETDLSKNRVANNRIKDWVTSPYIMIRPLYSQGYMSLNCTHWVQCTNDPEATPVFPGDSRITMVQVPDLKPAQLIPKLELKSRLRKEAPDFLAALLAIELPISNSRLAVPVVETEVKRRAMDKNLSLIEQFIRAKCFEIPGCSVTCEEFHEQMQLWLDQSERAVWSQNKVGRELPDRFPRGRKHGEDQKIHYGNLSFDPDIPPGKRLIKRKLYLEEEDSQ